MQLKSFISNLKYKILTQQIIKNALKEDIPLLDITSNMLIKHNSISHAEIIAKQDAILCGINITKACFKMKGRHLAIETLKKDGDLIKNGDIVMKIKGKTRAILQVERTALNFLQHLSGIATYTNKMVSLIKKYKVTILDTRKTIPGLRYLAKYAVVIGGGKNHRFHLSDAILIKENHIKANKGIENTLNKLKNTYKKDFEIEVENLKELEIALKYKVPYILLDNFKISDIKKAVKINNGQAKLEVSGGVKLKNLKKIAKTGVDYISTGCITHSARAADFSLILK